MNQRLKRKIEKRRRQQICEALDLCLQINGLQKSDQEYTGNHPTAFYEFSGHIADVSARIFVRGWDSMQRPDKSLTGHITHHDELDHIIRELRQLKKDLHSGNCGRPRN